MAPYVRARIDFEAQLFDIASLCLISLSAVFYCACAWHVFWFAGIEMAAVGFAFLMFARHTTDRGHIALNEECLLVEPIRMEHARQSKSDVRGLRVEPPASLDGLIGPEANGTRVEIGWFLTEWRRREFVHGLIGALASR